MNNKKVYLDDTYKLDCEKKIDYMNYIFNNEVDNVVDAYSSIDLSGIPKNNTYVKICTSGDSGKVIYFKQFSRDNW